MSFSLFEKLASVAGIELYMLLGGIFLSIALGVAVIITHRRAENQKTASSKNILTGIFFGALSFFISYVVIMLIQAVSALLAANGYAEIADIFAYNFTAQQFSTRLILSIVLALAAVIAYFLVDYFKRYKKERVGASQVNITRALVYGALCMSLSFVLSYFKLFSMPLGGSITLFSMLPLMIYAAWFGPAYGFTAAFAYSILQIVQGAQIIHWAQLILDYFLAFSCLGVAAFFPKKLALGALIAGILRMCCSTIAGAIFWGAPEGWSNAWIYALAYNGSTIGIDTILCVIVAAIPPVARMLNRIKPTATLNS